MIELKACIACGLEKPLSAFVKRSGGGGRRGTCRTCLRRRKRNEAPPAEAGARAAEAPALAAVAATGAESRTNARTAAVSAVATAAASAATAVHAARADAQSSPSLSATEPAAVPVEDSDAAAAAAVPKPGRKRRRRKKKQADLRREDKLDEADVLTLAGASGELDDEAVEERAGKALDAALDTEQAAEVSAISPKRKRNRRRNRKKHTELRRQDAPEAEAAANARLDAAAHASLAADADEAQAEDGGPEAADAPDGGQLALNGETDRDPAASPRKRKRKRRRGRGKSTKRKPAAEAGADTEETAAVRPPNRVIVPVKGNFSFKTSLLNDRGRGMIRLRGKRETGKRWSTEIPMDMAVRMVEEGAAGIIHPGLIHKLYTKADFRLLVLQRDDYICRYCGNFGDTIDHVMPKSKGGLSTPANCVCACAECNLKKADSLDYVDDEVLQQFL